MSTPHVLIVARTNSALFPIAGALQDKGLSLATHVPPWSVGVAFNKPVPDLVIIEWGSLHASEITDLLTRARTVRAGVLIVLEPDALEGYDVARGGDDFVVAPVTTQEVSSRLWQLLWRVRGVDTRQIFRRGDLVIDRNRYEVSLRGHIVFLTFKEYQLLCLLASNPGRVFTREALLNQIWEYDYYGGTRTVDVHIRRLRSKIEDTGHIYIETVWNVGYRFRTGDGVARSGTRG